jgi:hypothetical protein
MAKLEEEVCTRGLVPSVVDRVPAVLGVHIAAEGAAAVVRVALAVKGARGRLRVAAWGVVVALLAGRRGEAELRRPRRELMLHLACH